MRFYFVYTHEITTKVKVFSDSRKIFLASFSDKNPFPEEYPLFRSLFINCLFFWLTVFFSVQPILLSIIQGPPLHIVACFFFFYFCVVFHRTTALSFIHPIANDFLWFGWSETRWWRDTVVDQEKSGLSIYNSFTSCKRILCASCSHISNFSRSFLEMQSLAKKSFG